MAVAGSFNSEGFGIACDSDVAGVDIAGDWFGDVDGVA
jgi:hypothetical protein